ncbi:polysaccharide biosynthesis/export family protein [Persicitalea sp.]|uniref:polysaccharide biosynthesis/export family protein n=1 Tax=Persicitalea sp. TaxID=3100273 RepID=UPI0035947F26
MLNTQTLNPAVSVVNKGIYRIKAGDKLLIRNLNWSSELFPDPNQMATADGAGAGYKAVVRTDGNISLPELGLVPVAGRTRQAVADTLATLYQDLRNPLFEVSITSLRVNVLGSVNTQGIVLLEKDFLTLGEILAQSGGINYSEASNVIQIIRSEGTQQQVIEYDFQDLGNPLIMNQNIYDNDIVYVPPSRGSIRSVKYQRALVLAQPIITALNLTLIVINFIRLRPNP